MRTRNILFSLSLALSLILAACGAPSTPEAMMDKPTQEAMMDQPTEEVMMDESTATPDAMMMHETPTPDAMMPPENMSTPDAMMTTPDAMMEDPAWFSASLTNVNTGKMFTINDFKGKVVLVETMAVWCSSCLQQQGQVKALHEAMGMRDDLISVGLDIDLNENADQLMKYTAEQGFDWYYAVATPDVARDIAAQYSDQFLNPPSTPMLVIDRHGVAHPLPFGIKSADDLMKAIQPYLDEGM